MAGIQSIKIYTIIYYSTGNAPRFDRITNLAQIQDNFLKILEELTVICPAIPSPNPFFPQNLKAAAYERL